MKLVFSILILFLGINLQGQKITLPQIPKFDSTEVIAPKGTPFIIKYFNKGLPVFMQSYKKGEANVFMPYIFLPKYKEDSTYVYMDNDKMDFNIFYFGAEKIRNLRISPRGGEVGNYILDREFNLIEGGEEYIIKDLFREFYNNKRFRIGEWKITPTKNIPYSAIDYDKHLVDGKPIKYLGIKAILPKLKKTADKKLITVFGKSFFENHIEWCLDKSAAYSDIRGSSWRMKKGIKLFEQTDEEITFVDLNYNIIINEKKFPIIQLRVNKEGEIIDVIYQQRTNRKFHLSKGLDKNGKKGFHSSILNWREKAQEEGFNPDSGKFNARFNWVSKDGSLMGDLTFVLEEVIEKFEDHKRTEKKIKMLYINPWTGAQKWDNRVEEEVSIDN